MLRSGRVADQWIGATKEVAKRVNNTACHDIIDRNGERHSVACILVFISPCNRTWMLQATELMSKL